MPIFDVDPNSPEYPEKLREVREILRMSQNGFAELGGYSGVMQGRYEADRSKKNSAIPSERTAKAIRKAVASKLSGHDSSGPIPLQTRMNRLSPEPRSLKSVTFDEIELAISTAISSLVGVQYKVIVKDVAWSESNASSAAISLSISTSEHIS